MQKTIYLADWILPVSSPPISFGGMAVQNGRILAVSHRESLLKKYPAFGVHDFGHAVIVPSWVNAHCHLELSAFAGKISGFSDFPDWIRQLIMLRRALPTEDLLEPAIEAAKELAASGCVLTGDITNGDFLNSELFSGLLDRVVFYEILGFDVTRAETIYRQAQIKRAAENPAALIAPHAPYSTSAALIRELVQSEDSPISIHVAESEQESEFLLTGSGSFKKFLQERGVWDENWQPPGKSPFAYLDGLEALHKKMLLVHGVQVTGDDLKRLKESGTSVCVCARSNAQTGVGPMPVMDFLAYHIPLCVGTDSLAGNHDLDMNNEIYYLYKNSGVEAATLIRMATLNGAQALGQSQNYGALKAGLKSRFNVFSADQKIIEKPERFIVSKSWSSIQCY